MNNPVTIIHYTGCIRVDRVKLLEELYHFIEADPWPYVWLDKTPDLDNFEYLDAIHWLVMNLKRTAQIQLYSDGAIRLNFTKEYVLYGEYCGDDEKTERIISTDGEERRKCMFLSQANLRNTFKNQLLYDALLKINQEEKRMKQEKCVKVSKAENELDSEKTNATEKQYGKYDGGYFKDPTIIITMGEQELHQCISDIAERIISLEDVSEAMTPEEQKTLSKLQYALDYCAMHATKYGVEIQEGTEKQRVFATSSFMAWYLWWSNFFDSLSDEDFEAYATKYMSGEDVSMFHPDGDWRDYVGEKDDE